MADDDDILDRIAAKRDHRDRIGTELTELVKEAFDRGHTWQEIAAKLGVSRARVYQIRAGKR